MMLEQSVRISC